MEEEKKEIAKVITFKDIEEANKLIKPMKIVRENKQTHKKITKNYAEVSQRIKAFRRVYPQGVIITELVSESDGIITFNAVVKDSEGYVLANAHAREKVDEGLINKTNALENCETSAVGRALGMCGFGIDTSLASAEEVQQAIDKQENAKNGRMTDEQLLTISKLSPDITDHLREKYKKDPTTLTYGEAEEAIASLLKHKLIKTNEEKKHNTCCFKKNKKKASQALMT